MSVCVYIFVCVCLCVYTYLCVCMCMFACTHVCVCVCVCVWLTGGFIPSYSDIRYGSWNDRYNTGKTAYPFGHTFCSVTTQLTVWFALQRATPNVKYFVNSLSRK